MGEPQLQRSREPATAPAERPPRPGPEGEPRPGTILAPGEKVFIASRRRFKGDVRRHFIGEVERCTEMTVRVDGYAFVLGELNEFQRKPERRVRVFPLLDADFIINVIPASTRLDRVGYEYRDGSLLLTDGNGLRYDVDEFRM